MKFTAEADELVIQMEGIEMLLALKRRLVVPRSNITDLAWYPDFTFEPAVWRAGGAGIMGVIYAGRFRGGGKWYFLYLRQPKGIDFFGSVRTQNTLVITTQDFMYRQIVLTCQPDVGAGLLNWWQTA